MKHLPLVTKSRAKPPPSRPPPPNFALYALFAARLDKPTDKPGPRDRKEKVLSSCNSNRNFPSPRPFSLFEEKWIGTRIHSDDGVHDSVARFVADHLKVSLILLSDILRAESRSFPSLAGEDFSWRGKGRRRMHRSGDDKSDDASPITGLPFARRATFRYNAKTGSISVDSTTS